MIRLKLALALVTTFAAGMLTDRAIGRFHLFMTSQPHVAHIGILVSDMDKAIAEWHALGYRDIKVTAADTGIDRHYHNLPLDCSLKQAFAKGEPDIELLQPVCDSPNPWASELQEHGMQLHHLAFYAPDAALELDKARTAGLVEIAEGKWKDDKSGYGEFFYVRKPGDALIVEYLSHTRS